VTHTDAQALVRRKSNEAVSRAKRFSYVCWPKC